MRQVFLLLVGTLSLLGCASPTPPEVKTTPTVTSASPEMIIRTVDPLPSDSKTLKWQQNIGNIAYSWDGSDLLITNGRMSHFPLFRTIWREDVDAVRKEDKKTSKTVDSFFCPVAVVGQLTSFEHESGYLSGASAWSYRTYETRNAFKPHDRVVLSDLFSEQAILEGLLKNDIVALEIKKGVDDRSISGRPETLRELSAFLTVKDYSRFDAEYFMEDDYLSRFAFDRLDGDSVVIRLSLSPSSHSAQALHGYLELSLPIPPQLDQPLRDAASKKAGFLMPQFEETVGTTSAKFGT